MSTKNLARSVIEGGRSQFNKFERRSSNRVARVKTRQECHRLALEADADDEYDIDFQVERDRVWKSFDDKLAPLYRYLDSSVGRNYSKVVSEIVSRVDTRTTAGRHIVYCHALPSIALNENSSPNARFAIDRQGRLVRRKRRRYRAYPPKSPLPCTPDHLDGWRKGRAVRSRGQHWYWFEETPSGAFRQSTQLNLAELTFYRTLPEWAQEELSPEECKKALAAIRSSARSSPSRLR